MGRSVRISEETARVMVRGVDVGDGTFGRAMDELRRAIARLDRIPQSKPRRKTDERLIEEAVAKASGGSAFVRAWTKHLRRKPSKEEKRDVTASIREACLQRAGGKCECGCGVPAVDWDKGYSFPEAKAELDHFFGRGKVKQSVETCWILRADCHLEKTMLRPDAATWLQKFIAHCDRLIAAGESRYCEAGNMASRRLRFVETRARLPAAPEVG
jgi:hypothetical protein